MKGLPEDLGAIPADVLALLTPQVAKSYRAVPVRLAGQKLIVAVSTVSEPRTLKAIEFATDRSIEPMVVPAPVLEALLERYYGESKKPVAPAAPAAPAAPPRPAAAPARPVLPSAVIDDIGLDDIFGDLAAPAPAAAPAAPAASAARPAPAAPAPAGGPPVQKAAPLVARAFDPQALESPNPAAIALLSADAARNYHALPVALDDKVVTVAFSAQPDPKALRAIQYATGKMVKVVVVPRNAIEAAILKHYPARVPKAPTRLAAAPSVDPKLLEEVAPEVIAILRADLARKLRVVPVEKMGRRLTVAMEDPNNLEAVQNVEFVAGHSVKALRCELDVLEAAIERYYPPEAAAQALRLLQGADEQVLDSVEVVDEDAIADKLAIHEIVEGSEEEAPAVRMVNMLIREAVGRGASDIHIETYENDFRIRYRVDGTLMEVARPPRSLRPAMLSRLKVLSGMNIAETRMPQDGRIKLKLRSGERVKAIDLRVSDVPTIWGEKMVMRILDPDRLMLDMTRLGFDPESLERFKRAIVKPYGMVLVVGPSGCGKTNTLYSAMSAVNNSEVNIMTAEDPVEFNLKGINQVQTDDGVGLTFATALRSFLRQDPNIILVGEIRDYETAEIAMKASLTGHLVLSTLHTTDAPTTVSRLINMGIEPFIVATSVLLISAQRLVRLNCTNCCEPDPRTDDELLEIGFLPDELPVKAMKGRGCAACSNRGTKGRTALFEVLEVNEAIQELILAGATPIELKRTAKEQGMLTLRMSGLRKVKLGLTSIDEVTRETLI